MKEDGSALYFIALTPPPEISEEVVRLKNYFAQRFNSRHSLKSPPHITLYMPFRWAVKKEQSLVDFLSAFSEKQQPFHIRLNGFGSFPRRVIYIDVAYSEELAGLYSRLSSGIRKNLNIIKDSYKNEGFTAHMTLAHRDLRPSGYNEAWPEFRDKVFDYTFAADRISLLKHNGRHWDILREFPFQL